MRTPRHPPEMSQVQAMRLAGRTVKVRSLVLFLSLVSRCKREVHKKKARGEVSCAVNTSAASDSAETAQ